jgi:hypothetical protein
LIGPDAVLVRVPKTGSNTLVRALLKDWDYAAVDMAAHKWRCGGIRAQNWQYVDSYAFVRNPWDRMVSLWKWLQKTPYWKDDPSFDDFIRNLERYDDHWEAWSHRLPCAHYTHSFAEDRKPVQMVKYILRFEDYERDVRRIVGPLVDVPKLNATKHTHYSRYYTSATRAIVERLFVQDVNLFGYEFEDVNLFDYEFEDVNLFGYEFEEER